MTKNIFGGQKKVVFIYLHHSSEIRDLCLMKCPSEMFQNLQFFIYTKKNRVASSVFHFELLYFFPLMNALVYVDIDLGNGIH